MKLSISVSDRDAVFLDDYAAEHELPSRSAAVQAAIRALRTADLEDSYAQAWDEWSQDPDAAAWDRPAGDGL